MAAALRPQDGLLRRSKAVALTWGDVVLRANGRAPINVRGSRTALESEGVTLYYIGPLSGQTLKAIRPAEETLNRNTPVFGFLPRQIGRRVQAAAKAGAPAVDLGEGFTGHSGRVRMAQDLDKTGAELPALMTAGRGKLLPYRPATPRTRPLNGARWHGSTRKRELDLKRLEYTVLLDLCRAPLLPKRSIYSLYEIDP